MADVLLIDRDPCAIARIERGLQALGHTVWTTSSGAEGLEFLTYRRADAAIVAVQLNDMTACEFLSAIRRLDIGVPAIVATNGNVSEVVSVLRTGAASFIGKPISEARLQSVLAEALAAARRDAPATVPQAHAASRWAKAVLPIVDCSTDPRTIAAWGRCIAASPGAIRNWCFTAGIGPRRSLVFGRLLRVVVLSEGGRHKLENLMDVADRRTALALLRLGGFDTPRTLPTHPHEFLERQTVVRDAAALLEIERALNQGRRTISEVPKAHVDPASASVV